MRTLERDIAVKKISEMSKERVSTVLVFMAGMEAEHVIGKQGEAEQADMFCWDKLYRHTTMNG